MNNSLVLGVDVGGSHITVALVDLQSGSIVKNSLARAHVNSHGTVNEIIKTWSTTIQEVRTTHQVKVDRIGIAMPNPVDYESGVSYIKGIDKYDALYGLNIKELLARELQLTPGRIRMKNDAGCFLNGEAVGGAARGYKDAIGLTIGTGIGTARYHNGIAEDADLWHSPFKESIVEDYLSSRWFVNRYKEISGKMVKNVKELSLAYETNPEVRAVFDEFAGNLTDFLASFVALEKPEVIVIGGNIANASELFFPSVKRRLADRDIHVPLCKAMLGEEAAIIGAASCWHQGYSTLNVTGF